MYLNREVAPFIWSLTQLKQVRSRREESSLLQLDKGFLELLHLEKFLSLSLSLLIFGCTLISELFISIRRLLADRITKKNSTGKSPFELVYSITEALPFNMQIPIYKMLTDYGTKKLELDDRANQIIELDESRRTSLDKMLRHQGSMKTTFDKSTKPRDFQV